jgi:hypothetical protein
MTALIIFLVVIIAMVLVVINKKNNPSIPPPPPPPPFVTPTVTNIPPPQVREFCYAHEVVVTETIEEICKSENFITVYSDNVIVCDAPGYIFSDEASCKTGNSDWPYYYKFVRCGAKYSEVSGDGYAKEFVDCVF